MRFFLAAIVSMVAALPAAAQPWYARGEFNGYDTSAQMVDQGGGHYTATVSGLFSNTAFEYKLANADFSTSIPGSNGKVTSNAAGEINFHLYDNTTWTDGWYPNNVRRVGYDDPLQFGWEAVGSFNGWPGAGDPNYYLTSQGNGVYHGQFAMNAGLSYFKFRKQGDWGTQVGSDFGNGAGDNAFRVWTSGDLWNFDLDLPNGRWRAYTDAPSPDRNNDNMVDASDYVLWRNDDGSAAGYNVWRANFGFGTNLNAWYVRGGFNGFGLANQMTDQGGGNYTATVTGLTAGTDYEYKVANAEFTQSFPGSNGKVRADASGEAHFNFYQLQNPTWGDGWSPDNVSRVGYQDHNQFDWELAGDFNGYGGGAAWFLTDQGNGLHTGQFALDAGTYGYKFRQQGSWDTSIGDNFGNAAANNSITVAANGDLWNFELDLPNGKWRAYHPAMVGSGAAVPEPASIALVLLGALLGLGTYRRK